jgi:hypothetical protein
MCELRTVKFWTDEVGPRATGIMVIVLLAALACERIVETDPHACQGITMEQSWQAQQVGAAAARHEMLQAIEQQNATDEGMSIWWLTTRLKKQIAEADRLAAVEGYELGVGAAAVAKP